MTNVIEVLGSTSELVQNLPLSSVTLVLFTALWSAESEHARNVLHNASKVTQCDGDVRLYELSWPTLATSAAIAEPSASASRSLSTALSTHLVPSFFKLNGFLPEASYKPGEHGHLNITSQVAWLPCIQLFTNASKTVEPVMYKDSFDEDAIALFMRRWCHMVRAVDARQSDAVLSTNVTLLSRDRFAHALNEGRATAICGMLLIVDGGARALRGRLEPSWERIGAAVVKSQGVHSGTKYGTVKAGTWVVSVADTRHDANLMEHLKIADSKTSVSMLLVNRKWENTHLMEYDDGMTAATLASKLSEFCKRKSPATATHASKKGAGVTWVREKDRKMLSYYEEPAGWRRHLEGLRSEVSLRDWLDGRYDRERSGESTTWVVVYEAWCGFCQRILPTYRRFAAVTEAAQADVHVVMMQGCDGLVGWMDAMVDGFPTVLVLKRSNGGDEVEEYKSMHSLQQVLAYHDESSWRRFTEYVSSKTHESK